MCTMERRVSSRSSPELTGQHRLDETVKPVTGFDDLFDPILYLN